MKTIEIDSIETAQRVEDITAEIFEPGRVVETEPGQQTRNDCHVESTDWSNIDWSKDELACFLCEIENAIVHDYIQNALGYEHDSENTHPSGDIIIITELALYAIVSLFFTFTIVFIRSLNILMDSFMILGCVVSGIQIPVLIGMIYRTKLLSKYGKLFWIFVLGGTLATLITLTVIYWNAGNVPISLFVMSIGALHSIVGIITILVLYIITHIALIPIAYLNAVFFGN